MYLQAMFDAHPEMIARLREEGVDIDQLAREFPHELMEAVMGRADQVVGEGVDGLPGEGRMPGGGDIFAHEDPARIIDEDVGNIPPESEDDDENEDGDEPVSELIRSHADISCPCCIDSFSLCAWCRIFSVVYGGGALGLLSLVRIRSWIVIGVGQARKEWGQETTMWTSLGGFLWGSLMLPCLWY